MFQSGHNDPITLQAMRKVFSGWLIYIGKQESVEETGFLSLVCNDLR